MARLYAASEDGIARLEESGDAWTIELSSAGSGAQCLAVDQPPRDRDIECATARVREPR
jgi:hypothetical protein